MSSSSGLPDGEPPPSGPPGGFGVGLPPGVAPDAGSPVGGQQQQDRTAVASITLGLLSLPAVFCCAPLMLMLSVAGIATGIAALARIRGAPQRLSGRGLAIAGIAASIAGPVVYVLLWVLVGALSFLPAVLP